MTTIDKQQELMDILADKKKIKFQVRLQKPAVQYDDYIVQIDPEHIVKSDDGSSIDIDATFAKAGIESASDLHSQAQYLSTGISKAEALVEKGIDVEDFIANYKKALVLGGDTEYDSTWDDDDPTYDDTYEFGKSEEAEYNSRLNQLRADYQAVKKLKKSA